MIVLESLSDTQDLATLASEAESEGYRFVTRLITDWQDGSNRFDDPGETVLVAKLDDEIVGVCGLNRDPYVPGPGVGRVRHLYVSPIHRRAGVGAVLVEEIIRKANGNFSRLRLRTRSSQAADFYRGLGFVGVDGDESCTHQLTLVSVAHRGQSPIT